MDFGIPIEFANVPIYSRENGDARPPDATYCAIGRIRYSEVDGDVEDGTLIYIKPALYGTEPPDVLNYAHTSPDFPHEATANQFFTETQFESYRRLGYHIVRRIVTSDEATDMTNTPRKSAKDADRLSLEELTARIEAHLRAAGTRATRKTPA